MMPSLLAVLVLLAAPAPAAPPADGATIALKPGVERVLHVPGLAKLAVADPEVADVRPKGPSDIALRGLTDGRTEVLVWTTDGTRRHYQVVVGNPKTAPASEQTQALDRVVRGPAGGAVEELALTLAVGEEKAFVYSDVSKISVTQDSPVVEVSPLSGSEGVRIKGKAMGTAKVLLHISGRPAVRVVATVLDAASARAAAAGPARPAFGGKVLERPDCTGDDTTAETARLVAESVDLDRAKKGAAAVDKLLKVLELQPGAAHAYLKLGALYSKAGEKEKSAAAYETFVLSCPTNPATPKLRALLAPPKAKGK